MPRKDLFNDKQYNGYQLADENHTFSEKYLKHGKEMLDTMCERHSKVTQLRFDIRYPKEVKSDGTNNDFKNMMQTFTRNLSRSGYDPQYIAKREQVKSHNPHYHVAINVNGNKKRDRNSLIESAEKHWGRQIDLTPEEVHMRQLVYPCNHDPIGNPRENGHLIDRNSPNYLETKEKAIRQLSYLCKKDPDDQTPSSVRKFFYSQSRKDYDTAQEKKRRWLERNKPCDKQRQNDIGDQNIE